MSSTPIEAITDLETLRRMVLQNEAKIADHDAQIAARDELLAERDRAIVYKDAKIETLTAEIARINRWRYGAKAERFDPEQFALFEETAKEDIGAVESELEALRSTSPSKPREVPKRQALPAHLPRIEERCDLVNCTCGRCGADLTVIGEDISERLDCEPVKFFVRRLIRPKYACRSCETVTAAPVPAALIDRGLAAPGLLAHVLIGKYADHLPLYRQSEIYARSSVDLARSTLAQWVGATGAALQPLVDALRTEMRQAAVMHADETPVAMLDPGAGKTQRAYVFAYRRAGPAPIIVFEFCVSRSGAHARRFLKDYGGALVVDDYSGYKKGFTDGRIVEIACWARARRQFFELNVANKSVIAEEALNRIAALYAVEHAAKDFDPEARLAHRLQHAKPLVDALIDWLCALRPKVNNGSGTAKSIDYLLKRRRAFTRYLDDGRHPIDNNPIENAIRPIALGRKNWLFAGSETAGRRAAAIMSLIATAKANGHDPHAYLRDVLTRLPTTKDKDIATLPPHTWQALARSICVTVGE